jgi:predicted dehydrogenase
MDRRQFLKQAALATGAIALPAFIPAAALGRDGNVAPSNRVVMAGIGIGKRGNYVMGDWFLSQKDVQFVAICDVRKDRRLAIKDKVDKHNGNSDCKTYIEMDEVFARPDVDAIVTATGDRLHATVSVRAMRAGKDVYSEKPATMTIVEGQELVRTAAAYGRIYQAGMQRLSEANFIFCDELARSGRLGEIKIVYAHLAPWRGVNMRRDWLPEEPLPDPSEIDWDRWLGPCPWRPFNRRYVHGGWADHYDFYNSVIGEWGSHTFASCHSALDMQNTSPVHYPYVPNSTANGLTMTFANGIKMVSTKGGEEGGWKGSCGVRYVGTEGWCSVADNYSAPDVSNPALYADFRKIVQNYLLRTGREVNHVRNFLACVKSRRETVANPSITHRSMSTVHCANIAQQLRRALTWDPVKEEFVNDEQANRLRSRASREGWQIV